MNTALVWFRQDLRLMDNPALWAALQTCERVIPVYVHTPEEAGSWAPAAASNWWLHQSLAALDEGLHRRGSRLVIHRGESSAAALQELAQRTGAAKIFWNRCYEPALLARDSRLTEFLRQQGLTVECHGGNLLYEPWTVRGDKDRPYRVFTPFWRACQKLAPPPAPLPGPEQLPAVPSSLPRVPLESLGLLPRSSWDGGLRRTWKPGEGGALTQLAAFLEEGLADYAAYRDRPDIAGTSRLSPYLHFGEISVRQVYHAVQSLAATHPAAGLLRSAETFLRELGWREFAYHLLHHFPFTPEEPLDERYRKYPWHEDHEGVLLRAWQEGQTGYPMVDAGMRELWQTGWMHNRVRMLSASLLAKNLRLPWQSGARWFWDTLVDADLANNTLGWQWSAGCGADAAPYFRIFNPVLQGERFDPEGAYVQRWVPELAALPRPFIHQPWRASPEVLQRFGVRLGDQYPLPIIDFATSRQEALAGFAAIKGGTSGSSP
jgi:deoxyribodipyrimidine photo-lyase